MRTCGRQNIAALPCNIGRSGLLLPLGILQIVRLRTEEHLDILQTAWFHTEEYKNTTQLFPKAAGKVRLRYDPNTWSHKPIRCFDSAGSTEHSRKQTSAVAALISHCPGWLQKNTNFKQRPWLNKSFADSAGHTRFVLDRIVQLLTLSYVWEINCQFSIDVECQVWGMDYCLCPLKKTSNIRKLEKSLVIVQIRVHVTL